MESTNVSSLALYVQTKLKKIMPIWLTIINFCSKLVP